MLPCWASAVLASLWFAWEPLFPAIAWLMGMPWFYVVEAVLLGITAVGLLVVLIRAISAPGKHSQLELERGNAASPSRKTPSNPR